MANYHISRSQGRNTASAQPLQIALLYQSHAHCTAHTGAIGGSVLRDTPHRYPARPLSQIQANVFQGQDTIKRHWPQPRAPSKAKCALNTTFCRRTVLSATNTLQYCHVGPFKFTVKKNECTNSPLAITHFNSASVVEKPNLQISIPSKQTKLPNMLTRLSDYYIPAPINTYQHLRQSPRTTGPQAIKAISLRAPKRD